MIILSKEMQELDRLSVEGETEEIRKEAEEKFMKLFHEMNEENKKNHPGMEF